MKIYLTALTIFLAIDAVWLTLIAKSFYADKLGFLMKEKPDLVAAFIFYLIFIFGLMVFVINPALEKNDIRSAIFLGALFGAVTYATYDLTNLATVKNWPLVVTVIDIVWGAVLSLLVSLLTFLAVKKFF